jgi:hypothetical protein
MSLTNTQLSLQYEITDRGQLGIIFGENICRLYKNQWMEFFDDTSNYESMMSQDMGLEILKNKKEVLKFISDNNTDLV